ncbi:polysaccharide lyase-like protein [Sphingomonas sp. F9_3S_D5_B_2]
MKRIGLSMGMSRRNFCVAALGTAAAAGVIAQRLAGAHAAANDHGYESTLVDGLTPPSIMWSGRKWRCNMGSTWHPGMDYCLRRDGGRARFEVRPTPFDRGQSESQQKRRSELSGSVYGDKTRLPNGVPLWGAFSFIHHRWADPTGMADLDGAVHGQIHMGSKFGGSPALAFRRNGRGQFVITTRGEFEPDTTSRWRASLSFDEVHDLVYRVILDEAAGALDVWIDGKKVLEVGSASIGSHFAESYWNVGCYCSSGVTCPVVAEYSNHVYPGPRDLTDRTQRRPPW